MALLGVLVPVAVVVPPLPAGRGDDRRRMRWLLWAAVVDLLVMLATLLVPGDISSFDLSLAVTLTGAAVAVGILQPAPSTSTGCSAARWSTAGWRPASSSSTSPSSRPPVRCSATGSARRTPPC